MWVNEGFVRGKTHLLLYLNLALSLAFCLLSSEEFRLFQVRGGLDAGFSQEINGGNKEHRTICSSEWPRLWKKRLKIVER